METIPVRRRWFSISLRELAILFVAVGFALAWYREREITLPVRKATSKLREGLDQREARILYSEPVDGSTACMRIGEHNGVKYGVIAGSPNWWTEHPDWWKEPPDPFDANGDATSSRAH